MTASLGQTVPARRLMTQALRPSKPSTGSPPTAATPRRSMCIPAGESSIASLGFRVHFRLLCVPFDLCKLLQACRSNECCMLVEASYALCAFDRLIAAPEWAPLVSGIWKSIIGLAPIEAASRNQSSTANSLQLRRQSVVAGTPPDPEFKPFLCPKP